MTYWRKRVCSAPEVAEHLDGIVRSVEARRFSLDMRHVDEDTLYALSP